MHRRVIDPHRSSYPDPIAFEAGERVTVGERRDEAYPGWAWVTTSDGNSGWAPRKALDATGPGTAVAREAYTARELDTQAGERVRCLRELDGWTWVENERGRTGWVPTATLGDRV